MDERSILPVDLVATRIDHLDNLWGQICVADVVTTPFLEQIFVAPQSTEPVNQGLLHLTQSTEPVVIVIGEISRQGDLGCEWDG